MANSSQSGPINQLGRTATIRGRDAVVAGRTPNIHGRAAGGSDAAVSDQGGASQDGGQQVLTSCCTTRQAGVVIHASVEAFGPAGDTELSVNVKWPAASLGSAPCTCTADENTEAHQSAAAPSSVDAEHQGSPTRLIVRKPPLLPTTAYAKVAQQNPAAPSAAPTKPAAPSAAPASPYAPAAVTAPSAPGAPAAPEPPAAQNYNPRPTQKTQGGKSSTPK